MSMSDGVHIKYPDLKCFYLEPTGNKRGSLNLFKRSDTGEEITITEAPPGAMYDATWYKGHGEWQGSDGRVLMVKCPNGHTWNIDSRSSNCTMPEDNVHRCWVRHGTPPLITVNKDGNTCRAGGGSVWSDDFHGFLTNGIFTSV